MFTGSRLIFLESDTVSSMHAMAIGVVEFSREGYKIRKVFA